MKYERTVTIVKYPEHLRTAEDKRRIELGATVLYNLLTRKEGETYANDSRRESLESRDT